jgi:hypothetical protein
VLRIPLPGAPPATSTAMPTASIPVRTALRLIVISRLLTACPPSSHAPTATMPATAAPATAAHDRRAYRPKGASLRAPPGRCHSPPPPPWGGAARWPRGWRRRPLRHLHPPAVVRVTKQQTGARRSGAPVSSQGPVALRQVYDDRKVGPVHGVCVVAASERLALERQKGWPTVSVTSQRLTVCVGL